MTDRDARDNIVEVEQPASDTIRGLCVVVRSRNRSRYRREVDGRAEHVFMDAGVRSLRIWSFDEQQRRKLPIANIVEIEEIDTGEIFGSFDAWVASCLAHPRYRPDEELTKRWYMIRDGVAVALGIASSEGPVSESEMAAIREWAFQRMTASSINPASAEEFEACFERSVRQNVSAADVENEAGGIGQGVSKRQKVWLFTMLDRLAEIAGSGSAKAGLVDRAKATVENPPPLLIEGYD